MSFNVHNLIPFDIASPYQRIGVVRKNGSEHLSAVVGYMGLRRSGRLQPRAIHSADYPVGTDRAVANQSKVEQTVSRFRQFSGRHRNLDKARSIHMPDEQIAGCSQQSPGDQFMIHLPDSKFIHRRSLSVKRANCPVGKGEFVPYDGMRSHVVRTVLC
jgi:hypothetical protein